MGASTLREAVDVVRQIAAAHADAHQTVVAELETARVARASAAANSEAAASEALARRDKRIADLEAEIGVLQALGEAKDQRLAAEQSLRTESDQDEVSQLKARVAALEADLRSAQAEAAAVASPRVVTLPPPPAPPASEEESVKRAKLLAEIDRQKDVIAGYEREAGSLRAAVESGSADADYWRGLADEHSSEVGRLQGVISEQLGTIDYLNKKMQTRAAGESEVEVAKAHLERERRAHDEAVHRADTLAAEAIEREGQLKAVKRELRDAQEELANVRARLDAHGNAVAAEVSFASVRASDKDAEIARLRDNLTSVRRDLEGRLSEAAREVAAKERAIATLERRLQASADAPERLSELRSSLTNVAAQTGTEIETVRADLRAMEERLPRVEHQLATAKAAAEEAGRETASARAQLAVAQAQSRGLALEARRRADEWERATGLVRTACAALESAVVQTRAPGATTTEIEISLEEARSSAEAALSGLTTGQALSHLVSRKGGLTGATAGDDTIGSTVADGLIDDDIVGELRSEIEVLEGVAGGCVFGCFGDFTYFNIFCGRSLTIILEQTHRSATARDKRDEALSHMEEVYKAKVELDRLRSEIAVAEAEARTGQSDRTRAWEDMMRGYAAVFVFFCCACVLCMFLYEDSCLDVV